MLMPSATAAAAPSHSSENPGRPSPHEHPHEAGCSLLESRRCPNHPLLLAPAKLNSFFSTLTAFSPTAKSGFSPRPGPAIGRSAKRARKSAQHGGQGGFGFQSTSLIEAKGFHAHDGTAISLARLAGIKTGIITKRISETVALRARDLKIDHVYQGIQDKASVFAQILEKDGITAAEAAFVGDDVIDLPAMRKCGLAIAVKNARPEVKAEAHWVTSHAGGDGAARDAVEYILKAQGKWKRAVRNIFRSEAEIRCTRSPFAIRETVCLANSEREREQPRA